MAVGKIFKLKQDINGNTESRTFAFEFNNKLASGDSIPSNLAPSFQQTTQTTGAIGLTNGIPSVNGTQVWIRIGTTATLGALYDVSCTVQTTQGDILVVSGGIQIVASSTPISGTLTPTSGSGGLSGTFGGPP